MSVVSHHQIGFVQKLLPQLLEIPQISRVILTFNVPELDACDKLTSEKVVVLENKTPLGFSENHNRAFKYCRSPYFCVLNPDVNILENPFERLIEVLSIVDAGIGCPTVCSKTGEVEDSCRSFPTIVSLIGKIFGIGSSSSVDPARLYYSVPWCAGMCMVFKSQVFESLKGFDEGFYLYYEDVDICARAWIQGAAVVLIPSAIIVHDAQRDSHRKFKYLIWHCMSISRYLSKYRFGYHVPAISEVGSCDS